MNNPLLRLFARLSLATALVLAAACGPAPAPAPTAERRADSAPLTGGAAGPATMGGGGDVRQRQLAFLDRIRDADPQKSTIERALLNERNELGLVLGRGVEMDKIPTLLRGMLTEMAREFPGEDLNVIAYAPSNPPQKIGTARLDARTRDMTYTPER